MKTGVSLAVTLLLILTQRFHQLYDRLGREGFWEFDVEPQVEGSPRDAAVRKL
jgi:hypothetical protein